MEPMELKSAAELAREMVLLPLKIPLERLEHNWETGFF
jgi:hypothetical protein